MAAVLLLENDVEIPASVVDLASFRRWALSDEFPTRARIDYIQGQIEVDMSPEDLFTHGTLKTRVIRELDWLVDDLDLGHLVSDRTRISCPTADLSAEPDIVFLSHEAIDSGRTRLVPKATKEEGRFVEVEGAADLVVEIVSDSSVSKDTKRLPIAYFDADVSEYWLIDSRTDELVFVIHSRGRDRFEPVETDAEGYQFSNVFGRAFLLDRRRHRLGHWVYQLLVREED